MSLINIHKEEYLTEDKTCAVVSHTVSFCGLPLFKDTFLSQNISYLNLFDPERYAEALEEEQPQELGLYKDTKFGFKQSQSTNE